MNDKTYKIVDKTGITTLFSGTEKEIVNHCRICYTGSHWSYTKDIIDDDGNRYDILNFELYCLS